MTDRELDKMRERMQDALIQSKREVLEEEYGLILDGELSSMPRDDELGFLTYIEKFEQMLRDDDRITVWQRIGKPEVASADHLLSIDIEKELDRLLRLLEAENIQVDFLGDWRPIDAYRYLVDELLDEEIDAMFIEGMTTCFAPTTAEYEIEMGVEQFVSELFGRLGDYYFGPPLPDNPSQLAFVQTQTNRLEIVAEIWEKLETPSDYEIDVTSVLIDGETAECKATVTFWDEGAPCRFTARFDMEPSPYLDGCWDVAATTLLEELLAYLR